MKIHTQKKSDGSTVYFAFVGGGRLATSAPAETGEYGRRAARGAVEVAIKKHQMHVEVE